MKKPTSPISSARPETLWSHLHWLVVLGQQGSFTAAAERLGVSKAAMSQRISELERLAGVALVRRTTRSMRLTEAGEKLVDDTRASFNHIADSFAGIRDLAVAPRGLVRLTAPVAFARQQLVPRLPEFLRTYPEVRLELDMSDRIRSLATEGFDLAVRHAAAPPETHVAWTLASTRSVLVASRAYLRRRGVPELPADLANHHCLHYPRSQGSAAWTFAPAREKEGVHVTVPISGPFAANNSEVLRDTAISGLGIALMPDFSAQSGIEGGRLVEVLTDWTPVGAFGNQLFAVRPYSPHVPRAVEALVSFMRATFSDGFKASASETS